MAALAKEESMLRYSPFRRFCALGALFVLASVFVLIAFGAAPLLADRPEPSPPADAAMRQAAWERHLELEKTSLFAHLDWRDVGPVVQGGRVVDIATVPGEPYTFYVAYASGGLFKTINNGVTFEPLFDRQPVIITGDIAVDPSHPETVWVGTGENNSSRSSYGGMGMFRSDDGGKTWAQKGLEASDRIGRIVIDPRDGQRVFVAVLGKLYTTGGERGVYRTTDGGETWKQILAGEGGDMTGFIDLVMSPENPDVLYAAAWERSRRPWDFVEAGPGSGIYKSSDGGDSWKRLEGGFPQGAHVGRIGLALAASQPQTLYAALDNQELLPEDLWDLGGSAVTPKRLRNMTKEDFLAQDSEAIESFIRSNDFHVEVDAKKLIKMVKDDEITLEEILAEISDANANLFNSDIRSLEIYRSDDGGESWKRTHEEPIRQVVHTYGYYFGQVRVSPTDPDRIYTVGVPIITSGDGGKTFESIQDRGVHVDYHAMWIDPNFSDRVLVGNDGGLDMSYDGGKSWIKLDGQSVGQFYAITVDMAKPYNIYGGLQDNGTLKGSSKSRPGVDEWSFVGGGDGMYIEVDPRDNKTVYFGSQFGFYYRRGGKDDGGEVRPRDKLKEPALRYNWQTPILLSEHNHDTLYFGANKVYRSFDQGETWTAISEDLTTSENRGDVPYATLTTIDESSLRFGLLWAGTDDGNVWVTNDGGAAWSDVGAGLPRDRWVTRIEASRALEERAYLSLAGYRDDDSTAYLYVTEDLGATWTSIAANLPAEAINVVREDPVNADVLYVGTDRGVYVSLDRGGEWQALPGALPNVPVHDLIVHPRDRELVAGTHGRSIWVIDALPIQELSNVREEAVHVFPLENVKEERFWHRRRSEWFFNPEFQPEVKIPFWSAAAGTATLTVLDDEERQLRSLEMEVEPGVSVFTWDLLLDEEMGLAAETQRLAKDSDEEEDEDADSKKKNKKKRKKKKDDEDEDEMSSTEGDKANTPWAEALRLGHPLYVTSGSYTVRVSVGEGSGETDLKVKPPKARDPRMEKPEKIRGRKKDD
jgi:photosystem II stability/assembly factor-like uncharacterized protein